MGSQESTHQVGRTTIKTVNQTKEETVSKSWEEIPRSMWEDVKDWGKAIRDAVVHPDGKIFCLAVVGYVAFFLYEKKEHERRMQSLQAAVSRDPMNVMLRSVEEIRVPRWAPDPTAYLSSWFSS
eukprot:CAMPEP_0204372086 /NCGR_PEP_ID=MMETSP0469-20131031/46996_1 /ASSEMBLY_ACC=CAM_ASM_000384 /TAXON_ID=2969 /ORGANISM="Oxyrrhis marina" /LENGTH=123 /DNA_ID=CAMNT_0051362311 /DNA_START=80 /DNA_END=451 /DNA_ORIENTATION=-